MASIKQEALNHVSKETKNITELEQLSVNLETKEEVINEGTSEEWRQMITVIKGEDYRVPITVLKQLKEQLKAKPEMEHFRVTKTGSGMKTVYTVIPL